MAWTTPALRGYGTEITDVIYNGVTGNLVELGDGHLHTGASGDGGMLGRTEVFSGTSIYFMPHTGFIQRTAAPVSWAAVADKVYWFRFYLPFSFDLANITIDVDTASAGASTGGIGIYNYDGSQKLTSGTFNGKSATAQVIPSIVSLPYGFYILAWTCTSITPTTGSYTNSSNLNAAWNQTVAQSGTSNASSTAGVLPTTLGDLSAAAISMPIVGMEG